MASDIKQVHIVYFDTRTSDYKHYLKLSLSKETPNLFVDASRVLNVRDHNENWHYVPLDNVKQWFVEPFGA